jgi:hypothetical protein
MDPRPLICGLAMGQRCAEQHPNERGATVLEVKRDRMERVDRANEETVDVKPEPASLLPTIKDG